MAGAITTYEDTETRTPRGVPASSGRPGWIVALSLATGLVAALLFAALPVVPVAESAITGAVLCGFALGWAMLWLLSLRFTDQPQRWAAAPALFMGVRRAPARDLRLPHAWGPQLGLAAGAPLVGDLDAAPDAPRHAQPQRPRPALPGVRDPGAVRRSEAATRPCARRRTRTPCQPTGRLIDVGGHKLYLNCVGSGSPTVVLEPGAGGTSSQLGWITPAVARTTRVCVYDRAGRGWSETADTPQDGAQIATDLHTLLHRAGETGPYVLAGHSFGGLYVRIFAAHYPDEVAGLVLVDSTASKEPATSVVPSTETAAPTAPSAASPVVASLSARVGLARVARAARLGDPSAELPRRRTGQPRADELDPQHHRRVHAGRRLGAGSCLTSQLRRQASLRLDSRPTPGFLDDGSRTRC